MSDAMTDETTADGRAEHAIEKAQAWTRRAGRLGKRAAERLPAGVVVVVGGTVLLAADAFGIGEVIIAGAAGYGAYRMLRRRARRQEAQQRAPEQLGGRQQPTEQSRSEQRAMEAQP